MSRRLLAVAAALAVSVATINAHHSYADFLDEPRSVEGTIQTLEFASPHTMLTIVASDGTVYKAIWNAARQLDLQGVERTALRVGDAISITGHPHKDDARHEFAKLREVRLKAGGWTWRGDIGRVTRGAD